MSSASEPFLKRPVALSFIYFGMAGIEIVTIIVALMLSHTTSTAFERGVTTSAAISARQNDILHLILLARAIDAPPNDIFDSHNVRREREHLMAARSAFDAEAARVAEGYRAARLSPLDRDIVAILAETETIVHEMYEHGVATLDHYAAGDEGAASQAMAHADSELGMVMRRLEVASLLLQQVRASDLEAQLQRTEEIRRFEYWLAGAVCVIAMLVAAFGSNLVRALRQADAQRTRMLEEAAAAREKMRRYADEVSHELRGPVAKVRLDLEVLLGAERSPSEYRAGMERALVQTERLSSIVEALLFMARADGAPTALKLQERDLRQELETLAEFYSAVAEQAGLTLEFTAEGSVLAEKTLFQRALANLVRNAIAHTAPGGVVRVSSAHRKGETELVVQDNGAGIEPALLARVFDRFQRGSDASDGMGLGLAIVQSIMSLHQGRVEVESELGSGTIVRLFFPDASAAEITER